MSLTSGATLGPYAIRSQLGQGGMGVVYLVMAHYEGETLKERIARGTLRNRSRLEGRP